MRYNPYTGEEIEGAPAKVAATTKWLDFGGSLLGGVLSSAGTALNATVKTIVGALPGGGTAAAGFRDALTSSVAGGSEKLFSGGMFNGLFGKIFGGVVAGARLVEAGSEAMEGRWNSAAGRVSRAVVEGLTVAVSFGPVGVIALPLEILSRFGTGKFLSTHLGDAAENFTEAVLGVFSGAHEGGMEKKIASVNSSTSAAVATNAVAPFPRSQQFVTNDGQNLSIGGPPPPGGAIALSSRPVIPRQAMAADYDMQRWRDVMPARGRGDREWQQRVEQSRYPTLDPALMAGQPVDQQQLSMAQKSLESMYQQPAAAHPQG